jgi:hypothetical protein
LLLTLGAIPQFTQPLNKASPIEAFWSRVFVTFLGAHWNGPQNLCLFRPNNYDLWLIGEVCLI